MFLNVWNTQEILRSICLFLAMLGKIHSGLLSEGFPIQATQKSKMSQGEEEERKMMHTLAFHAEGKNLAYKVFYLQSQFFPFV